MLIIELAIIVSKKTKKIAMVYSNLLGAYTIQVLITLNFRIVLVVFLLPWE